MDSIKSSETYSDSSRGVSGCVAASRVGMDGVRAAFGHLLPTGQGLVREKARMTDKLVGEDSGVDPAFKYASNQNDLFARYVRVWFFLLA